MRAAVVGAGIGGLSVAAGLQSSGADVSVFERAPQVRASGSGLSIFGNGLRALDLLGLRDEFESVTDRRVESFAAGQRKPDGSWIARLPTDSVGELRIIDRADLHRILLGALSPGTVRTCAEVTSASPEGMLTFRSGPDEPFDFVVGADGLRSRVRTALDPAAGPLYSGYSAWRGITDRPVDLGGAAGETVGRGLRFGIAPLRDGRVYWFAVANMPEDASFHEEKAAVRDLFSGWHSPIAELIESTPAESIARTPISDLDRPLPTYHRGRIVLLGDAAHAMTPNLGQGGGQALEDAATLTTLLAGPTEGRFARFIGRLPTRTAGPLGSSGAAGPSPELGSALRRFDALRRPRSQLIARNSRLMGQVFQLESPLLAVLRNAVFSAVPSTLITAQAASVQKWSPPASPW